jgi:protein N-terminal asparagine amidohydrolase
LKHFTTSSPERLVYVGQGEVGHATSTHCDVIASDKATTCHILAFRSVSTTTDTHPLVSLTHVDTVGYETCIRNMVKEHARFHNTTDRLTIQVYILGGFENDDARQISNYLIRLVSQMAEEFVNDIQFVLQTCAISSMNDNGAYAPIGRGMGIDIATGDAFLCKVDGNVAGPSPQLRAARLWSGNGGKALAVVHTSSGNTMVVTPFTYSAFAQMDTLLRLSDPYLLQYTSTSPELEEDDFCSTVRSTLLFMGSVPCQTIFVDQQPAVFCRKGCTNQWIQQHF